MIVTVLPRDDDITHIVLTGRLDTPGAEEISERFAEATVGAGPAGDRRSCGRRFHGFPGHQPVARQR